MRPIFILIFVVVALVIGNQFFSFVELGGYYYHDTGFVKVGQSKQFTEWGHNWKVEVKQINNLGYITPRYDAVDVVVTMDSTEGTYLAPVFDSNTGDRSGNFDAGSFSYSNLGHRSYPYDKGTTGNLVRPWVKSLYSGTTAMVDAECFFTEKPAGVTTGFFTQTAAWDFSKVGCYVRVYYRKSETGQELKCADGESPNTCATKRTGYKCVLKTRYDSGLGKTVTYAAYWPCFLDTSVYCSSTSECGTPALDKCSDGTAVLTCSVNRPMYCLKTSESTPMLIERASLCGCPSGTKQSGEFCVKDIQQSESTCATGYEYRDGACRPKGSPVCGAYGCESGETAQTCPEDCGKECPEEAKPDADSCTAEPECNPETGLWKVYSSKCGTGQLCVTGQCVDKKTTDCNEDSDCTLGKSCRNGKCMVVSETSCELDDDCATDYVCDNGLCVKYEGCRLALDCPPKAYDCASGAGTYIVSGQCVDGDCYYDSANEPDSCIRPDISCTGNEDCANGWYCGDDRFCHKGSAQTAWACWFGNFDGCESIPNEAIVIAVLAVIILIVFIAWYLPKTRTPYQQPVMRRQYYRRAPTRGRRRK